MTGRRRIAIVGAGPRGLAVLERICANARDSGAQLSIFVIDPYEPGAGAVWRRDQPAELLMNTVASQISAFPDDSVSMLGRVESGPSLYEWAAGSAAAEPPETSLKDALAQLGPDDYPSRRTYGEYLLYAFRRIVSRAPFGVEVTSVVDTVRALRPAESPRLSHDLVLRSGGLIPQIDHVVMSLGHSDLEPNKTALDFARLAAEWQGVFVPPANPADAVLTGIMGGEDVIVRGLGLNFFDYVALLTVGRGGRFTREDDGLKYQASGREPRLHVSSRRGLPHHARGRNEKGAGGRAQARLLTETRIQSLQSQHQRDRLSFKVDVWPLIARDVECTYYERLLPPGTAASNFADAYLNAKPDSIEAVLLEHGLGRVTRWDWTLLARPWSARRFQSQAEFQSWMRQYLLDDVAHAQLGNVSGPIKSALDLLRDVRNEIRAVIDHNGIDGQSYIDDVDHWYTPLNAFFSIGPPLQRIEELVALMDAGIVRFIGPEMSVAAGDRAFVAKSAVLPGAGVVAKHLIEARLPTVNARRSLNPLIQSLLRNGQTELHHHRSDEELLESGGLAVTPRPFRLISSLWPNGHPRLHLYGVPTESLHWVTAAGARPGVDSVTFRDADAISLAVLADNVVRAHDETERTLHRDSEVATLAN